MEMHINHEMKFVYIHVPRTGGNSMMELWKRELSVNIHERYGFLEGYEDYFSFGFIRNPWSRMFSFWRLRTRGKETTAKDFQKWLFEDHTREGWLPNVYRQSWYMLEGVDYIAKFENFEDEWDYIFKSIGLERVKIPHVNQSTLGADYRDYYDDEMKSFIETNFAKDIEIGEYKFD